MIGASKARGPFLLLPALNLGLELRKRLPLFPFRILCNLQLLAPRRRKFRVPRYERRFVRGNLEAGYGVDRCEVRLGRVGVEELVCDEFVVVCLHGWRRGSEGDDRMQI